MLGGGELPEDARKAWRRLQRMLSGLGGSPAEAGHVALQALSDIGVLRRLLDRVELTAVRAARAAGRSWTEIATELGVSRQSAWERWRDLDDDPQHPAAGSAVAGDEPAVAGAAAELVGTRGRRRGLRLVAVPDLIGLSAAEARDLLHRVGLSPVAHNPGGPPTDLPADAEGTVVDQVPRAGSRRRTGSSVTLWLLRGGGSAGVREPLRSPTPPPPAAATADHAAAG